MLGQWGDDKLASLLLLSLTGVARMYFVGLPEHENMTYLASVEALQQRFGQETDTSIALQELVGLKRSKKQTAKELADRSWQLASHA